MSHPAVRAALLVTIVLSAAAVLLIGPAGAAEGFAGEGDIDGANPVGLGATEGEFIVSDCAYPPDSQGVDGWIFELPPSFATGGAIATVTGTTDAPEYDLDFQFYAADCAYLGASATGTADETAPLPPQTGFVVVNQALGAATHICLVVGEAACGGDASPSTSSSSSGSPSGSASPSPSGSAGGDISTSIEADETKTDFRSTFVLSGKVDTEGSCERPYQVTIRKRQLGGENYRSFKQRVPVGKDNRWRREVTSRVSASYVARVDDGGACGSGSSEPLTVKVRALVHVNVPDACSAPQRVTGRVRPDHPRSKVVLEQETPEGWATADQARLDAKSRFVVSAPACSTPYRVVWPSSDKRNARGVRSFEF